MKIDVFFLFLFLYFVSVKEKKMLNILKFQKKLAICSKKNLIVNPHVIKDI